MRFKGRNYPEFRNHVGIFFITPNGVILHLVPREDGEHYGDFINYPYSHDDIWEKYYHKMYSVDFDFFPRGRIIYHKPDRRYWVYYDGCSGGIPSTLSLYFNTKRWRCKRDEHYKCYWCNPEYGHGIKMPTCHGWVPCKNCLAFDEKNQLVWPPQVFFRNIQIDRKPG